MWQWDSSRFCLLGVLVESLVVELVLVDWVVAKLIGWMVALLHDVYIWDNVRSTAVFLHPLIFLQFCLLAKCALLSSRVVVCVCVTRSIINRGEI